jgi:hypothetical protein
MRSNVPGRVEPVQQAKRLVHLGQGSRKPPPALQGCIAGHHIPPIPSPKLHPRPSHAAWAGKVGSIPDRGLSRNEFFLLLPTCDLPAKPDRLGLLLEICSIWPISRRHRCRILSSQVQTRGEENGR